MLNKDKLKSAVYAFIFNPGIRLYFSIFIGLIVNVIYIGTNIHTALMHRSFWSSAITVYYLLFVVLRLYLLWANKREERAVMRCCLTVGIFLLLLTLSAGVIIAYSVVVENSVKYSGYVLLAFFVYATYALSTSVVGMKKWLNDNKPLHFAARSVTFAAALMSAFNLQYSLMVSLGLPSATVKRANAIGGFIIFSTIATISVALVLRSAKGLKISKICRNSYNA